MSVGMAIAQKWLAEHFDRPSFNVFDYNIYAVCGDGCMMEGISSEAASLAGHLGLDNLCWVYDNNHITIEGDTRITFTEDVAARFLAYGWNVLRIGDANDIERIQRALDTFREAKGRPTFIVLDSHIGYGSPNRQDTAEAHGEPLGDDEVRLAKRSYGWPENAKFLVPDGVYQHFADGIGCAARTPDNDGRISSPRIAPRFRNWQRRSIRCNAVNFPLAGIANSQSSPQMRKESRDGRHPGKILNALAKNIPWLIGGSADPRPRTKRD